MDRHARSTPRQLARLVADTPRERPVLVPLLARDYLTCGPRRIGATLRHLLADPGGGQAPPRARARRRGARRARSSCPGRGPARSRALLPRGRLVEVPGVAHAVHHRVPDEVARIVRSLRGLAGEPSRASAGDDRLPFRWLARPSGAGWRRARLRGHVGSREAEMSGEFPDAVPRRALLVGAGAAVGATAIGEARVSAAASSPVVHADRKVTFRLAAPEAADVVMRGGWGRPSGSPTRR